MTSVDLPPGQARVLVAIRQYVAEHGRPPVIREIASALGFASTNGVMCHLNAMRRKGLLTWTHGASRSITLVGNRPESVEPTQPADALPLSLHQHAVVGFVARYVRERGFSPTLREILSHLGTVSFTGLTAHLKALQTKGYIRIHPGIARGITVLREPPLTTPEEAS